MIKTSEVFISPQARLDHRSGCGEGKDSQKIKTSEVFFQKVPLDTILLAKYMLTHRVPAVGRPRGRGR